jgi:His/Glu/Gln/Arg/opine family amino acid ABC transporter permease subunit
MIDFKLMWVYAPFFLRGALITINIASIGCLIGISLGTLLGIAQTSSHKLLRYTINFYVTIIRGTPMLIQISFAVFVLPQLGLHLSDFWAATCAIGFNSAAYVSQIIRSGIQSVGKGQIEAARTLGLNTFQINRFILIPQALRSVLPALGNELITLVKDSSLASTVGVMELSKQAWYVRSRTFDALSVYCAVGFVYLIITSLLSLFIFMLEQRLHPHAKH